MVTEGNSGRTNMLFTVTLTGSGTEDEVQVDYQTSDVGTATPGVDYEVTTGTVSFAASDASGERTKPASVMVNGDDVY